MHRFYIDYRPDADVEITGQDVTHIRSVLRLSVGDEILVGDGSGRDYLCRITEMTEAYVRASVEDIRENFAELPAEITLYQGLPKGEKMDLVIQKAVEIGAARIIPVEMERSVIRLDANKKKKRVERFARIAEAAAKQSGRGIIPQAGPVMTFAEALEDAKNRGAVILLPYENAEGIAYSRKLLADLRPGRPIAVFIGPEGGFADREIALAKEAGAELMTLGHRILRTETAGLYILSLIAFQLEEDE